MLTFINSYKQINQLVVAKYNINNNSDYLTTPNNDD